MFRYFNMESYRAVTHNELRNKERLSKKLEKQGKKYPDVHKSKSKALHKAKKEYKDPIEEHKHYAFEHNIK